MSTPAADAPVLICLTPIRNEAWILDRFLKCASLWADHIVIADQASDDGSREIALRYPKVTLVENKGIGYHEGERQRLVFEAARKIPGRHILLAIDADEMITANWMESAEWKALRSLAPGTVVQFQWVNVLPDFCQAWMPPDDIYMGFADDGKSGHRTGQFHIGRLPVPPGAPVVKMRDVKVLHYQYTDWGRMKSKQRGYQTAEFLSNPAKRPVQLYRQYHTMDAIPAAHLQPIKQEWLEGYERRGVDMRHVESERFYPRDFEIIDLLIKHGVEKFRRLDIWDRDWTSAARELGKIGPDDTLDDPRTPFEKRVHRWLQKTQPRAHEMRIRWIQRALRLLGW